MGVTFAGAFVMVILAYIAQSPGFAARIGLGGTRIVHQVKTFTGYALAFMLLFTGFFLAGVPLDPRLTATAVPTTAANLAVPPTLAGAASPVPTETAGVLPETEAADVTSTPDPNTVLTPSSGAFGGPPPGQEGEPEAVGTPAASGLDTTPSATAVTDPAVTPSPTNTVTPVTFTPTPTHSPTPTATATPTITPTPIDGQTAVLNLGGSVIWLRRSPGGQNLLVLQDQETVILHAGRANRAGILWREVATGDGTVGWVEEQFLLFAEDP